MAEPKRDPASLARSGRLMAWLGGLITLLSCGVIVLILVARQRGVDVFGEVRVAGMTVPRGPDGVEVLAQHAAQWASTQVTLHVGPYVARVTRAELGASLPIAQVSETVRELGRTGNPLRDLVALAQSLRGGLELTLRPIVDRARLSEQVQALRKTFERPSVAGSLLPDGRVVPGLAGLTVNSVTATERLAQGLEHGATDLELHATPLAAPDPRAYAGDDERAFSQTMIAVQTTFHAGGAAAGRARNIELAAAAIDGAVLPPGGELSFNARVGERSQARGFAIAKELANRRVVDGVGGGVCQVAATLHAAAFLSGLSLPDYQPHSRPVRYIELGLDTMVTWPRQDMRIANSYPFPIRVRSSARDGVLQVRLEGSGKAHPVEWNTTIVQRTKPGVKEVSDDSLRDGERVVVQSPMDGLLVRRVRTIYYPSGPRTEQDMLRYPPTDRILALGGRVRAPKLSGVMDTQEF